MKRGEEGAGRAQGYAKLIVWREAAVLRRLVYRATQGFPSIELRRVSQMRDAARSVKQNIQEGYARRSLGEYIRFLEIAKSSLAELKGDIDDCLEDGLLGENSFKELDSSANRTDYLLFRLLQSLRNKRLSGRLTPFPDRRLVSRK